MLKNIKPGKTKSGAVDKTKYTLDETIRSQAHTRVKNLLDSYPVYPEIDLAFLLEGLGMHEGDKSKIRLRSGSGRIRDQDQDQDEEFEGTTSTIQFAD